MELYTLNRSFLQQEVIDKFESSIWTERYFGAGDFELRVPATSSMMSKLPKGQLMMCEDSVIPMIIETREVKDKLLKVTGIDLVKWLNNRIFRTKNDHAIKEHVFDTMKPGALLTWLVQNFAISGSYLNGTNPIAVSSTDRNRFDIPGLVIGSSDASGSVVEISLPFGQLYDVLNQVATTYEVGMKLKLDFATASGYQISFHSYKGADRTSSQSSNPVIQFSPEMDSFADITDLESISDYRNLVLAFAANAPATYMTLDAGRSASVPNTTDGFDLRIEQIFADFDTTGKTTTQIQNVLNGQAKLAAKDFTAVQLVDGEIVQTGQIKYEQHYFLGDLVEVKGNSGVLQKARITEYIRSQDEAGERAYPTLAMIDE